MLLRSIRARLLGLVLATVIPFAALIGCGLWNQLHSDQAEATERTLNEARLLAAQVDDHVGNVENLLTGLSRAVSTNPADTAANDTLLHQVKAELPDFISNIMLFSLDGSNIGTSADTTARRVDGSARSYFREVLAGNEFSIGEVIHAQVGGQWVLSIGAAVRDQTGRLRAVLAIGTQLDRFQDALRLRQLPSGCVVRIVNQDGIVVAQSVNGPNWIGRDLHDSKDIARYLAAKEASEVAVWSDGVKRITGSSTAHRVPWLVSVGLPTSIGFAEMETRLAWGALFIGISLFAACFIAWMLSGRIVGPLRQLEQDAAALAGGDLGHRTTVATHDEVGSLAETFNRMAASLQRRESEAEDSKNMLAAIIDASPVAIVCSDMERRVILWNPAAEKLYGYTAEQAIGSTIRMVPPEGRAQSLAMYQRAQRRDRPRCGGEAKAQERRIDRRQRFSSPDVWPQRRGARCRLGARRYFQL